MIPKLNLKEQPELVLKLTNANRTKELVFRYSVIEYNSKLYLLDEDGTTLYILNKELETIEEFCRQQSTTRFEYRTFYFRSSSGEDITEKYLNQTNKTPQIRKWGTPNRKLRLNGDYLELSDMSKGIDMKLDRNLAYSIIKSLKQEFNISEEVK